MPWVKTIFIVRHPVERAWSEAYVMCVKKAGRRLEEVSDETFIRYIESPPARNRNDQVRALDNWRRIFPEDQLFVSPLDTIAARPKALLQSLFRFLGVGADIPWQSLPYADRVMPVYEPGGYVYGGRAEAVSRRGGPPPMPEGVRRHLEGRLACQLAGLTERLGDQVAHWSAGGSSADRQMPVRAG